jgi:hypothetical protein
MNLNDNFNKILNLWKNKYDNNEIKPTKIKRSFKKKMIGYKKKIIK